MGDIKANEKKIMDALRKLSDSVFGLESKYTEFCYSDEEGTLALDEEKTKNFISELLSYAKADVKFLVELEPLLVDFIHIAIRYIDCTFSPSEQKLSSIKKIADTVRKERIDQVSTFDILITDQKEYIDSTTYTLYENFTHRIVEIDQDAFYLCTKHALEKFADDHMLNCLYSEELSKQFARKITRFANEIAFEYRNGTPRRRNP